MGQCIGNCIRCELVSDEEKVTCCTFQTLRQTIELRKTLKGVMAKLEEMSGTPGLPSSVEPYDADSPAAELQG